MKLCACSIDCLAIIGPLLYILQKKKQKFVWGVYILLFVLSSIIIINIMELTQLHVYMEHSSTILYREINLYEKLNVKIYRNKKTNNTRFFFVLFAKVKLKHSKNKLGD